jgi:hypothetical protein
MQEATVEQLMELPYVPLEGESSYTGLLIIQTKETHDSGFPLMAVIGVRDGIPTHILNKGCDDIRQVYHATPLTFAIEACRASGGFHYHQPVKEGRPSEFRVHGNRGTSTFMY